jgi:hypothetical protein
MYENFHAHPPFSSLLAPKMTFFTVLPYIFYSLWLVFIPSFVSPFQHLSCFMFFLVYSHMGRGGSFKLFI